MLEEAHQQLRKDTVSAVQFLGEVVRDPTAGREIRLRAAGMILDRTLGKPTESVDLTISGTAPWVLALQDMTMVGTPAQASELRAGDVIDAEVVEDDPVFADEPADDDSWLT